MCKFLRNTFLLFTLKYWFAMIDVVVKQFSSLRKERKKMFNKIKNQENIMMIFFVVTLLFVGIYAVVNQNVMDVIYFFVLLYYFFRFLMIRRK